VKPKGNVLVGVDMFKAAFWVWLAMVIRMRAYDRIVQSWSIDSIPLLRK
jgi:hypothetical protein